MAERSGKRSKAQDVLVALKLALSDGNGESYAALAKALGMSASEVHASVGRLTEARLLEPDSRGFDGNRWWSFYCTGCRMRSRPQSEK